MIAAKVRFSVAKSDRFKLHSGCLCVAKLLGKIAGIFDPAIKAPESVKNADELERVRAELLQQA